MPIRQKITSTLNATSIINQQQLIIPTLIAVSITELFVMIFLEMMAFNFSPIETVVIDVGLLTLIVFLALRYLVIPRVLKTEQAYISSVNDLLDLIDNHCIFAMTDKKGNIIDANSKLVEISGYQIEEIIGQNHRIFNSGYFNADQWHGFYDTLNKGQNWQGIIRNKKKSGQYYWVYTTVKPVFENGKLVTCLSLRSDVSDLVTQTDQMLKAYKELEAAEQNLSQFTSNIVHELRTPLHIITNVHASLLGSMQQQHNINMVREAQATIEHMKGLVNELLDLSKIKHGDVELSLEDFDLYDFLEKIRFELATLAADSEVALTLNIDSNVPHCIKGDAKRLKQVIYNLVSNAKKFTTKGAITISVSLNAPFNKLSKTNHLDISVIDTGTGIKPDEIDKIFGEFYQVKNATASIGTGLGLAISRKIVHLMGGEIYVSSEYGSGSTFTISIPVDETVNVITKDSSVPHFLNENILSGKHILVIDDTHMNLLLTEQVLSKFGAMVTTTSNPREAVAYFQEGSQHFDAILIDQYMPELDGIETTLQIRSTEKGKHIPIIGLSGSFDDADKINAALTAGMTDTLSKPFDIKVAVNVLNKHLR